MVNEGDRENDQADKGGKEEVADEHIVTPKKCKPVLHILEEAGREESQKDREEAETEPEDSKQETREETPAVKKAKKSAATSILALREFSLDMINSLAMLRQLNYFTDVNANDNLRKIVRCLPVHLIEKWKNVTTDIREKSEIPQLKHISDFV